MSSWLQSASKLQKSGAIDCEQLRTLTRMIQSRDPDLEEKKEEKKEEKLERGCEQWTGAADGASLCEGASPGQAAARGCKG
jgi:hypothetical protein